MSSKLIVVLGATGTQGGSVVDTFLKESGWKVRGLTRNATSASAQKLNEKGVEVVTADLGDPASLVAAFKGAYAIFSVTDFWTIYNDPEFQKNAKPGQALNKSAYEVELQHGKNVFDAASQTEGLERLIFSNLSDATRWSNGKYKLVYHFDSKAHATEYGRTTYPDLWKKTSVIQVGFYLLNYLNSPFLTPRKDETGTYVIAGKMRGDVKLPHVAPEEDTGPFTKALIEEAPGKNLIAYRSWSSLDEILDLWGTNLGVKTKTVLLPFDLVLEGIPEELEKEIAEMGAYCEEFGYEARDDPSVIHPRDLEFPPQLPTAEEWIKKQDWSKTFSG